MVAFFSILIAIFAAASTVIASIGPVIENKRLTKFGWLFIGLNIGLISLLPIQYFVQEKINDEKEMQNKIEQFKRDSILRSEYKKSSEKQIQIISDNLGKYGYKFDSTRMQLVHLIDSSKHHITVTNLTNDPNFILSNPNERDESGLKFVSHQNGHFNYILSYYSADAGSCCYDVKVSAVLKDSANNYIYLKRLQGIDVNERLSKGQGFTNTIAVNEKWKYDTLFLYVRGTFKNTDASKTFNIDKVYFNAKSDNAFGSTIAKQLVVQTIKSHEK